MALNNFSAIENN